MVYAASMCVLRIYNLHIIITYLIYFNVIEIFKYAIDLPRLHNFHRLKHLLAEASDDFDPRTWKTKKKKLWVYKKNKKQ